jgi:hypothetical protein
VGDTRRSGDGCALLDTPRSLAEAEGGPSLTAYSLASGGVAMLAGAVAGTAVAGNTGRIAVWCSVSAAVSTVAGLLYETAVLNTCWRITRRWLSRSAS